MRHRLVVTNAEFKQMQNLINVINTKTISSQRRKIAKAQYESMMRFIKVRPANRRELSRTVVFNENIG